jgi:hypothetical protein
VVAVVAVITALVPTAVLVAGPLLLVLTQPQVEQVIRHLLRLLRVVTVELLTVTVQVVAVVAQVLLAVAVLVHQAAVQAVPVQHHQLLAHL